MFIIQLPRTPSKVFLNIGDAMFQWIAIARRYVSYVSYPKDINGY
jgi:hypothetical protein